MLIDAHCHLSGLSEEELAAQIQAAKDNKVHTLVAIGAGYGYDDNLKTLNIANSHDNIYCALAMHPHDAKEVTDENYQELSGWIKNEDKVRAVGEIGLDFHYMNSPKEQQIKVLKQFTALALEVNKPLVIHDRDCDFDCVDILKEAGADKVGGMVHCFSGTQELADRYLDLGFNVSFTGIITFKKAQDLRDVVKNVPLDRLMVETDSPFLAPVPFRGRTNQPAYVKHVAECVAEVKGISFEKVCQVTTENTKRFFRI